MNLDILELTKEYGHAEYQKIGLTSFEPVILEDEDRAIAYYNRDIYPKRYVFRFSCPLLKSI